MTTHRLPKAFIPAHYRLRLDPNLETETFAGKVEISGAMAYPNDTITLNAKNLNVSNATISCGDLAFTPTVDASNDSEQLTLRCDQAIDGEATISLEYTGEISRSLEGMYISEYRDLDGQTQKIATTQFEPVHARSCFPCLDEPTYKAVFEISAIVNEGLAAFSNGEEISREPRDDNKIQFNFAPTMKMSTYLVAMVIGKMDSSAPIDVDGTPIRVVHRPGQEALTDFALEVAEFALQYQQEFFGVNYPGGKMDLIALSDFSAGAMENQGAITFRETLLLIDKAASTKREKQNAADVISHEIAHMWFGNLVTMDWWDGLWLKEAFATFMELKTVDAYNPQWRRWEEFLLSRAAAFNVDASPRSRPIHYEVNHPAEAEGMFDVITYKKGASIVRMLEQFVTEPTFAKALNLYMQNHSFGNTTHDDLWNAIAKAADEPIDSLMSPWLHQSGFPLVTVTTEVGGAITLTQEQYKLAGVTYTSSHGWTIPLRVREIQSTNQPSQMLLGPGKSSIDMNASDGPILVNVGSDAYCKVLYEPDLQEGLTDNLAGLSTAERFGLLDDCWFGVLAGKRSTLAFLNLVECYANEPSRSVWLRLIGALNDLNDFVGPDVSGSFNKLCLDLIGPKLQSIGLTPSADDSIDTLALRGDLIQASGILGADPLILDEARRTVSVALRNPELVDPNVAEAAISVVARTGDESDFETFYGAWKAADTPALEQRFLETFPKFSDEKAQQRFLQMIAEQEIRSQSVPFLLRSALSDKATGTRAWNFVKANWDDLLSYTSNGGFVRTFESIHRLSQEPICRDVLNHLHKKKVPVGQNSLNQSVDRLVNKTHIAQRQIDSPGESFISILDR